MAIIGILVAVSIPIFTSQLEKARESTDIANMRAAKAAAVVAYLGDDATLKVGSGQTDSVVANYDAEAGKLTVKTEVPTNKYGKGTTATGDANNTYMGYVPATAYTSKYIEVTIATDGTVTEAWK